MEGSRDRILTLLQRHNRATVEQLSQYMELASATVRRHLDILQRDQMVAFEQVKKRTGRPEYAYFLTDMGQEHMPKEYGRLLSGLLDEISGLNEADMKGRNGADVLELLFRRMAYKTVGDMAGSQAQGSPGERVERLVVFLEAEQFQPEAEITDNEVSVVLYNCPFRSVALDEPRVCEYDQAVITAILGTEVSHGECIRSGSGKCCYVASLNGVATQ